jgi:hypothetical protein
MTSGREDPLKERRVRDAHQFCSWQGIGISPETRTPHPEISNRKRPLRGGRLRVGCAARGTVSMKGLSAEPRHEVAQAIRTSRNSGGAIHTTKPIQTPNP